MAFATGMPDCKAMNNTKQNGLQNAHFLIISVSGLIYAIRIRERALHSLERPLESNYSKETNKNEQKFLAQNHE